MESSKVQEVHKVQQKRESIRRCSRCRRTDKLFSVGRAKSLSKVLFLLHLTPSEGIDQVQKVQQRAILRNFSSIILTRKSLPTPAPSAPSAPTPFSSVWTHGFHGGSP